MSGETSLKDSPAGSEGLSESDRDKQLRLGREALRLEERSRYIDRTLETPLGTAGHLNLVVEAPLIAGHIKLNARSRTRHYTNNQAAYQAQAVIDATEAGKDIVFSGAEAANVIPEPEPRQKAA